MRLLPLLFLAACQVAGASTPPDAGNAAATTAEPSREEILAASDLPELLPDPLPDDPLGVTVHRLGNGMTVYIATDRQEPSFYGWIGVRAGSRNDPADATGLAHYLEHMLLFKGTDELGTTDHAKEAPHLERIRELYRELATAKGKAARDRVLAEIDAQTQEVAKYAIPNEIGRLYTGLGMTGMNAFTNKDRTYFVQKVPANRVVAWATVEAERFGDPVFRLFFPELEAVYEEKNRGLDSSSRWLWNLTNEGLYPEHPLGTQTTLGEVEHLKTPAFDAMIAFHERWYVPNNMAIILAGDIDASVLPLLEEKFGRLSPRPLEAPPPGKLTRPKGRVVKEFVAKEAESLKIGWRTVAAEHEDAPLIEILNRLLDDDRNGLLNVELEQPRKVQRVGASATFYREGGHLAIDAVRREGQTLEDVEGLVRATVAKLADVTEAQVEAAKLHVAIDRKLQIEFPQVTAGRILDAFVQKRQWADVVAADKRLETITRAQVVAAAKTYLGDDFVVVFQRNGDPDVPKVEKPKITPLDLSSDTQSKLAAEVAALPAETLTPVWTLAGEHYEERQLPAGRLVVSRNERNDVFLLAYAWNLGHLNIPMLCTALEVQKRSGTDTMSTGELQRQLYALGSTISTGCDDDSSQIFIRGIERNLEATLQIMDAWFAETKIEAETLSATVEAAIERRSVETESEDQLTSALQQFAYHDDRSFWKTRPSSAALRRLTPARAERILEDLFNHQHRVVYVGTRGTDEAAKLLARGKKHKKVGPRPAHRYRKLKRPRIFFLHRKQAKATVQIILASPPRKEEDVAVHEVLSRYIGGGTGSITFREIRTKRSLAYAVGSGIGVGNPRDEVRYSGWMQNQADKVAEAVPALLNTMRRTEIERGRFAEARGAIEEQYRGTRVNPLFVVFEVDNWREDGYDGDPRPARFERLESVAPEDIAAAIEKASARPPLITIIGDEDSIDLQALETIAPIERIDPMDLFTR